MPWCHPTPPVLAWPPSRPPCCLVSLPCASASPVGHPGLPAIEPPRSPGYTTLSRGFPGNDRLVTDAAPCWEAGQPPGGVAGGFLLFCFCWARSLSPSSLYLEWQGCCQPLPSLGVSTRPPSSVADTPPPDCPLPVSRAQNTAAGFGPSLETSAPPSQVLKTGAGGLGECVRQQGDWGHSRWVPTCYLQAGAVTQVAYCFLVGLSSPGALHIQRRQHGLSQH